MTENNNYTLIKIISLFTKWRKVFIFNILIVGILSSAISFLLPKWYESSSVILPPTDQSMGSGFSALLNSIPLGAFGLGGASSDEMTYLAILKSRTLKKDIIQKFNLFEFYEKKTMHETLLAFESDYDVEQTEENMIKVSFEYKDSKKVAEIVNYIVDKLSIMSTGLMLERAKNTKEFIEKRYFQNLNDLDSLSKAMEQFQNTYGILEFEEQTKAVIVATAEIEINIYLKRAELEVVEKSYGIDSPQYYSANLQLESLQTQLTQLKFGQSNSDKSPFASLFIQADKIPGLGKSYAKLYTNLLLQSKLQEFLLPEYEQAKLQLMKDKPTLQVLDYASIPDKKSKPKRMFIVAGSIFISFLLTLFILLVIEHVNWLKVNKPEDHTEIMIIARKWLKPFSKVNHRAK